MAKPIRQSKSVDVHNILGRPAEDVMRAAVLKALGLTSAITERIGNVIVDAFGAVNRHGETDHRTRLQAADLTCDLLGLKARVASARAQSGPLKVEVTMPQWLRSIRQDGARVDSHSNAPSVNRQLNSGSPHAAPSDGDRMETGS